MKTDNADKIDELPGWSSNPYDVMAHPETPVSENTADNRITANTDFIANSEPHPMAIDPKQITMQEVPQPDVNPMAVDPATITMSEVNAPQSAVHPMAIDPATITMPEVAAPQPQATQQPQPSTNPPAQMGWPEKAARWVKGAPLEMPGYLLSGIGKGAEAVLPDSIGKPVSTALQAPLLAGHNLAGTASPYENQEWINQANQQFGAAAPYITGFAHGFLNSYVPETQTEHGTWTSAGQSAAELAGMAANMGGMSTKAAVKVLDHIAPGVLNKLLGSAAISMGAYGAQTNAPDIGTTIKNTAMGALMGKLFAVGGNVANAAISKLIPSAPEWLAKMIATYALGTAGGASEHADSWKERLRNMMMGGPVFLAAHAVNPYSYMKDSATAEDLTKTNQVVPPPDAVSDLQTGLDKMNALDNEYGAQQGNEGQGGTDTGAAEQLPSMLGQGNEGQTPKDPELIISLKQLGYSDDEINAMSHADAEYINLENPYQYPQALKEMGIDTTPEGKTEAETAPESYAALKGLGYPDSEIVDMDAGRARDIIDGQVIYKPEAVDSANNMAEKPHEQSDTNNYSANNSAKLEDSQQAIDNSPAPNEPETTGTGVEPQEGLEAAHAGDDGSTATSEGQTTDKQKQLEALGVKLQPPITTEAIQKQLENLGIKQEKGHNQEDSYPIKVKYIAKTGGSQRAEDTMSYKAAIERLFNAVAEKIGSMHRLILGPVSEENADAIRQAGSEKNKDFDVSGYRHSIDNSFVNHALKEHGDPKTEEPRGLIAITKEDIARIPEIVNDYDKVEYIGKTKLGKDVFLYTKRINGEVYYYEEIRQGKKELAGTTLFKKKATGTGDMPPLEAASPSTSETLTASPSSTSTIPQKSDTGQENPGQFALKEGARPSENPTRPVDLDQTYRDILDNLKKTLGPNVKLETYEGPRPPGVTEDVLREGMAKHGISGNPDEYPPIRGMYTHELGEDGKWYHVIRLATAENMADISNHEAFHGIQKILELTGRQKDMQILNLAYGGNPERMAEAYRDYVAGKTEPKNMARRIFDRITDFIEKLKNYLGARGFRSANDIFGEAYAGKLAEASDMAGELGSPSLSLNLKGDSRDELDKLPENLVDAGKEIKSIFAPANMSDEARRMADELREKNAIRKKSGIKAASVKFTEELKKAGKEIKSIFAPASMSDEAKLAAGSLREMNAVMDRKKDIAISAMKKISDFFNNISKEDCWDFIDNMEHGRKQATPELQAIADIYRAALDDRFERINKLDPDAQISYLKNFFPHLYKNPEEAKIIIMEFFAKDRVERRKELEKKMAEVEFDKLADIYKRALARQRVKPDQTDPETIKADNANRQSLDELFNKVNKLSPEAQIEFMKSFLDYIHQDPEEAAKIIDELFPKGRMDFFLPRTIPTMKFARAMGLEMLSDNPNDMVLQRLLSMDKYIMARGFMNEMADTGLFQFVETKDPVPNDLEKIDNAIGDVWIEPKDPEPNDLEEVFGDKSNGDKSKGRTKAGGGALIKKGSYYGHKDAVRVLNNYLSPGLRGSSIFKVYMSIGNVLNQAQLGLSFFHTGAESINAVLNQFALGIEKIAGKGTLNDGLTDMATALKAPIVDYAKGGELQRELDNPEFKGEIGEIAKALMAGGGAGHQDSLYQTQMVDKMNDALREGKRVSGLLKSPFALLEQFSSPIFEKLVPRLKLGAFYKLAEMELKRNPQLMEDGSREQLRDLMGKAWDSIDNRMGQVRYDNIFWNKVLKDLMMASVRSVGWTGGTIREIGGGLIDAGKMAYNLKKGGLSAYTPDMITHRMAYTASLVVVTGIMGAVTQFLLSGKGPEGITDLYYPKTGNLDEYGNPERISYPTYMKDIVSYGKHPFTTITNKVHPLMSLVSDMLNNKDFYGHKVYNEGDPLTRQAIDIAKHTALAFEPFASRGIRQNWKQNFGHLDVKVLFPMVGITPAPAAISKTAAQTAMDEERAGKAPAGGRNTNEQNRVDLKLQIERLMKKDPVEGQQLLKENLSKFSSREVKNIEMSRGISPYRAAFQRLPIEEALKVYELGTPKEKEEYLPLLGKKLQSLVLLSADKRVAVIEKLKELGVMR